MSKKQEQHDANVRIWTLWEVDGQLWELYKILGNDENRKGILLAIEALNAILRNAQEERDTLWKD